jgi:hypothetical protein
MSVQNESLDVKPAERKPEAPELEYKAASQDSLSMFFAAIGGAVLGMLATLLILALINGGTLNFIHPERLAVIESDLSRINENVGAVSTNVTTVSDQVAQLRSGMSDTTANIQQTRSDLDQNKVAVAGLATTVGALQVTGQRFVDRVGAANGANVAASGVPGAPVVVSSSAVKPGNIAVLFFADANGNARMDDSEANVVGIQVAVKDAAGKTVGNYTSTDAGILIEKLAPGQYTLSVENAAGNKLAKPSDVTLTVPQSATDGQIVYFPAAQ